MNYTETHKTNSGLIQTITLLVFLFMFSFSGFSQSQPTATIDFNQNVETTNVKVESSRTTTNMEFALWFMGTKQDPNAALSTEGANAKKLIITSGIAPNRLLIKALLKKVVNYENSLS